MHPLRTPVLRILQTLRSLTIRIYCKGVPGGLRAQRGVSRVAGSPYRVLQCPMVTTRSYDPNMCVCVCVCVFLT